MKMKKIISVLIHDRRGGFNVRKGLIIILLVASFATGVISYSSKPSALGRVKLSTKKVVLIQGKSCTIRLKGAKIKKVVWKSNNKKIATVRKGKIKAKKSGRCSVIAKYKGKKKQNGKNYNDNILRYLCSLRPHNAFSGALVREQLV